MSHLTPPATVQQFKEFFDRGFAFGPGKEAVRDKDVTQAMAMAMNVYNPALWRSDPAKVGFLYLTAHNLALAVQAAGGLSTKQGGRGGAKSRGSGVMQSKTVGGVAINYAVMQSAVDDPVLNQYLQTEYGKVYLTMLAPKLVGGVDVVDGPSDPGTGFPPLIGESQ